MTDGGLALRAAWDETAQLIGSRHEARWVLEVACSLEPDEFTTHLDQLLSERMVAHLDQMTARIVGGEPLAYVLGRWQFRHVDLAIDRRVLIPRPETELVAGVAIELARAVAAPRRVADLGTGSGAIGLAAADELPLDGTEVWITDASHDALDVARANLAGLGRAATNVRIAHGEWGEALPAALAFDVIISNPPYVATNSPDLADSVRDWEPPEALFAGADGLDAYRQIIASAPDHLRVGGWLVLEIGADQGAPVADLLASRFENVEIRQDLAGHDRIALATVTNGARHRS